MAAPVLLLGLGAEAIALVLLAISNQGWMVFAIMPLFALGGVGLPALQSLVSRAVNEDHQGRLQGVLSSLISLTAIFSPIVFSGIYATTRFGLSGAVWLAGAGIYLLAIPLFFRIPARADAKSVT